MRFSVVILAVIIAFNAAADEVETFSNFQDKNAYPLLIPEVQKLTPLKSGFRLPDSFTLATPKNSKLEIEIIENVLSQRFPKIRIINYLDASIRGIVTIFPTQTQVDLHTTSYIYPVQLYNVE